ncbi:MAG TPA: cache domain-containing protein, partial [Candidatus Limnocylindria bacterium]|nr:cache domain-containing protein [Candidatus Limnocylindria bacterium]
MSRFPGLRRPADSDATLLRRGTIVLLVAVFVAVVLLRGSSLWWRHEEIVIDSQHQTEKFVRVLSEHLQQTVATIDATFEHLVAHSLQVGGPGAAPENWSKVLEVAFSGLKAVDRISVLDSKGVIRHSTRPQTAGEQRADHPVFGLLAESMDVGLVAKGSFRDPDSGRLLLPVARALTARTNEFDGVVAALFDPQLLGVLYREVDVGARSIIAIISQNGEIMYRQGPGGDLSLLVKAMKGIGATPEAYEIDTVRSFDGPLESGGEHYFTVARRIDQAPLAISISIAQSDVLRPWRAEVRTSLIVIGTAALLFAIGAILMSRALRARSAADLALKESQARFQEIMYHAPIFVSVKDTEGRIKFINKALEDFFGYSREEVMGKKLDDIVALGTGPGSLISSLDVEVIDTKAPL